MPKKNQKKHAKRKTRKANANTKNMLAGEIKNRYNCGQNYVYGINDAGCDNCVEQKVAAWREANRGRPDNNKIRDFYNECARESAAQYGWKKPYDELPDPAAGFEPMPAEDAYVFDLEEAARQAPPEDDPDNDDIDLRGIAPLPRVRRDNFLRDYAREREEGQLFVDIQGMARRHGLNPEDAAAAAAEYDREQEQELRQVNQGIPQVPAMQVPVPAPVPAPAMQEQALPFDWRAGKKSKSKSKRSKSKRSKSKRSRSKSKRSKSKRIKRSKGNKSKGKRK